MLVIVNRFVISLNLTWLSESSASSLDDMVAIMDSKILSVAASRFEKMNRASSSETFLLDCLQMTPPLTVQLSQ